MSRERYRRREKNYDSRDRYRRRKIDHNPPPGYKPRQERKMAMEIISDWEAEDAPPISFEALILIHGDKENLRVFVKKSLDACPPMACAWSSKCEYFL